jgi:hypothetical protein
MTFSYLDYKTPEAISNIMMQAIVWIRLQHHHREEEDECKLRKRK